MSLNIQYIYNDLIISLLVGQESLISIFQGTSLYLLLSLLILLLLVSFIFVCKGINPTPRDPSPRDPPNSKKKKVILRTILYFYVTSYHDCYAFLTPRGRIYDYVTNI